MPDKVRSVDDMVADMEKAVEEPEGNTSSGKHRQHVAQAIEKLITSQIVEDKVRYIEDGTGSKPTKGTAPALLMVAAAVQEMVSEMSGRKMSYTITIGSKDAAAAAPKPTTTGKPRGRPPKDPAKKAAEAEQKRRDDHKKAISEFDKVYDERQKYLDAGIGDEFAGCGKINTKHVRARGNSYIRIKNATRGLVRHVISFQVVAEEALNKWLHNSITVFFRAVRARIESGCDTRVSDSGNVRRAQLERRGTSRTGRRSRESTCDEFVCSYNIAARLLHFKFVHYVGKRGNKPGILARGPTEAN